MNETLDELKAIRDGAPDGAICFCSNGQYWKVENKNWYVLEQHKESFWVMEDLIYLSSMRSLDDIKAIIELIERVNDLDSLEVSNLTPKQIAKGL